MNKIFILLAFFISILSTTKAQLISDWIKTGPLKQPRYYLKNSHVILCGVLDDVEAFEEANKDQSINIESCLQAKDSMDGKEPKTYKIIGIKNGKLLFNEVDLFENREKNSKQIGQIYNVSANAVATLWAVRYPQGDLMILGPRLCDKVDNWRTDRSIDLMKEFPRNPSLPFPTKSKPELVRYHSFEYHMGCGT
jgi:hypothetical protein